MNERAPAGTAHTAVVSTTTRPWRTPRGLRGSLTCANPVRNSAATVSGLRTGGRLVKIGKRVLRGGRRR
jgi:hypothetical protein